MIASAARTTWTANRAAMAVRALAIGLCVGIGLAEGHAAQSAEDAFGIWRHPENGSLIRVYPCGQRRLCIRILSVTDAQRVDDNNPDSGLRNRPIVGLVIVDGAERTGNAAWSGSLYNRTDGRHYDGHIKVVGRDRLELTGCAIVLLCRSMVWRRER